MTITYFAFDEVYRAEQFIGALMDHGAVPEDISVVAKEGVDVRDSKEIAKEAETGITTTTSGDVAYGAAAGANIGLGLGVAAGLASLFVPGIGLVAGGGAVATAIAGALGSAGAGAIAGGLTGYLRDLGIKDEHIDDWMRFYQARYVIVALNRREDGIEEETVWELAKKYGAAQSSPNTYADFKASQQAVIEVEERLLNENPSRVW